MMVSCCENCEYWRKDNHGNHSCVNRTSGNYGDYTHPNDGCFEYEDKSKETLSEIIEHLGDCVAEINLWIDKLREVDDD